MEMKNTNDVKTILITGLTHKPIGQVKGISLLILKQKYKKCIWWTHKSCLYFPSSCYIPSIIVSKYLKQQQFPKTKKKRKKDLYYDYSDKMTATSWHWLLQFLKDWPFCSLELDQNNLWFVDTSFSFSFLYVWSFLMKVNSGKIFWTHAIYQSFFPSNITDCERVWGPRWYHTLSI